METYFKAAMSPIDCWLVLIVTNIEARFFNELSPLVKPDGNYLDFRRQVIKVLEKPDAIQAYMQKLNSSSRLRVFYFRLYKSSALSDQGSSLCLERAAGGVPHFSLHEWTERRTTRASQRDHQPFDFVKTRANCAGENRYARSFAQETQSEPTR